MCVCVCVCVCVHYYRLMIKYHQLTFQSNNYIDLQLHSYQQNKQTNKQIETIFIVVSGGI